MGDQSARDRIERGSQSLQQLAQDLKHIFVNSESTRKCVGMSRNAWSRLLNNFDVVQALKPLIEDIFLSSQGFKEDVIAKLGRDLAANQVYMCLS